MKNRKKSGQQVTSSDQSRLDGIYAGRVMSVFDTEHNGRLWVEIPELNQNLRNPRNNFSETTDTTNWLLCSYMTPFGGSTNLLNKEGVGAEFKNSPTSYGFWAIPPDPGTRVLVMFINGSINHPVWIGCMYENYQNHSVPGIATNSNAINSTETVPLPVTEYSKRFDGGITRRPIHEFFYKTLKRLGLLNDGIRGPSKSSARREAPSAVFGLSTPGPRTVPESKDDFSRTGGHQFIMDDGDVDGNDQLIRIRTSNGAQILLHDKEGLVYISNSKGTGWVEIGPSGNIDIFGSGSFSVRAEKDINLRADKNINIDAGEGMNIKVGTDFKQEVGASHNLTVGKDYFRTVGKTTNILSADLYIVQGKKVHFNGPSPAEAAKPDKQSKTQITKTEAETDQPGTGKKSVTTVVSRFPTLEPYPEHHVGAANGSSTSSNPVDSPETRGNVKVTIKDPITNKTIPIGSYEGGSTVPSTVIGTPTAAHTPGIYEGVGYEGATPIYEKVGDVPEVRLATRWKLDEEGLAFIANFEEFRARAYHDVGGLLTIGHRHLLTKSELASGKIKIGEDEVEWKKDLAPIQALKLLLQDAADSERRVKQLVKPEITQSQYNALTSWVYNVGGAAANGSTLLAELNKNNFNAVPTELQRWVKIGGKPIEGLSSRRKAEAQLFSKRYIT